jgi:hypothetical protein
MSVRCIMTLFLSISKTIDSVMYNDVRELCVSESKSLGIMLIRIVCPFPKEAQKLCVNICCQGKERIFRGIQVGLGVRRITTA